MTYREFEQLAMNPPEDKRPSVFVLHVYRYAKGCEPAEYPEFDVDCKLYYFVSLEQAIDKMQEFVGSERLYCFQIKQIPLGIRTESGDYSRLWLYNRDGFLLDRSYASSIFAGSDERYEPFRGRTESNTRFRPGDIIEYLAGDCKVRIGVVLYTPCSVKRLWEQMTKHHTEAEINPNDQYMDFSDDNYIVIDEDYECWGCDYNVQSYDVLPLSMPLPEDMQKRLMAKYEWATEGEGN
ncbi:MAG: hypothetical protein NC453_11515 [Muribaculum sp.]|nr:hypothetical protein [Muribaculum sp.]